VAVETVPLVLDCFDATQAPVPIGRALIVPSWMLLDPADHVTQLPTPVSVDFSDATPTPQVSLVPTDDSSLTPAGWAYTITFSGMSNPPPPFSFSLPYDSGDTTYLSEVTHVAQPTEYEAWLALTGGALEGPLGPLVTTLADAAVVTVNAMLGNDFELLMTAAVGATRELDIDGGYPGQKLTIDLIQPASGGPCAVTYSTGFEFGNVAAPQLSAGAGYNDLLGFRLHPSKSRWQFLGPAAGFA
jgi:hypothetical protein